MIREANRKDVKSIVKIRNEIIKNSTAIFDDKLVHIEKMMTWCEDQKKDDHPILVAVKDNIVVGYGTYGKFRNGNCYSHTVEHGLHITEEYRGKGLGSQLLGLLIQEARNKSYHTMIAGIDSNNIQSAKLHKKYGFKEVGQIKQVSKKFDKLLDLTFMQLIL